MATGVSAWSALGSLLHELRRRRVVQVALAYAALALVIVQVGDTLVDALEWPVWVMRLLIGGLALGFPLAIGLAWFFDLTPAGLTRDLGDAAPDTEGPHLAALLALQPVGDPAGLRAPLRRLLLAGGAQRCETDGRGLVAEFRSARDALHCALRALAEHGSELRAALSIGEVSHDHGHYAGAALAELQAVSRHAVPGGLALNGAVREANLARLHPEIGAILRAVEGGDEAAHAWVARAEDVATLAFDAAPRATTGVRSPAALVALAAAVLLAVGVGALVWLVGGSGAPRLPAASIAVLPFTSLSDEREDAWFAEGLGDEMMSALAGVEGLQVAARASAYALRGEKLDIQAIGQRLGVASVLEATVRRDGQRLRITAQLSDTRNGTTVWTATYDEELRRPVRLAAAHRRARHPVPARCDPQRRQAAGAAPAADAEHRRLRGLPARAGGAEPADHRGDDREVARLLPLRARRRRRLRARTGRHLPRRDQALHPRCAWPMPSPRPRRPAPAPRPWTRRCARSISRWASCTRSRAEAERGDRTASPARSRTRRCGSMPISAWPGSRPTASNAPLALTYFDRAAALSPGNWSVYSQRGYFHYTRKEYQEAISAFRTALTFNPMNATMWSNVGGLHQFLGQTDEAIDAFARSLAIEPTYEAYSNLGTLQFGQGRYADWQPASAAQSSSIPATTACGRTWAMRWPPSVRPPAAAGDAVPRGAAPHRRLPRRARARCRAGRAQGLDPRQPRRRPRRRVWPRNRRLDPDPRRSRRCG